MQVSNNTVVGLRYIMTDTNGNVMENTMNGPMVEYVHGIGSILPQLEQQLTGLNTGEQISFSFRDDSVGHIKFEVIVDAVREAAAEELASGKPRSALQKDDESCGPDCCC